MLGVVRVFIFFLLNIDLDMGILKGKHLKNAVFSARFAHMGLICGRSNDSVDMIRFFNSSGALEIMQGHDVKLVLG